jgi:hypothetical protein
VCQKIGVADARRNGVQLSGGTGEWVVNSGEIYNNQFSNSNYRRLYKPLKHKLAIRERMQV